MFYQINTLTLMASPSGEGGGGGLMQLAPFLLIMVVFYFFMIRPQAKKAKTAKQFKNTIGKGDKIVTIGGVHGKIIEVKDNVFIIDVGGNNRLTIEKSAISMELTKSVQGEGSSSAKAEDLPQLVK